MSVTGSVFSSLPILLRSRKLHVLPIEGDGNCFYRALSVAIYKDSSKHALLRKSLCTYISEHRDIYLPLFESPKYFQRCLAANKRLNVWNSAFADILPHAVANYLQITLEVYAAEDEESTVHKYVFTGDQGTPRSAWDLGIAGCEQLARGFATEKVRLLYTNGNHYDLLLH